MHPGETPGDSAQNPYGAEYVHSLLDYQEPGDPDHQQGAGGLSGIYARESFLPVPPDPGFGQARPQNVGALPAWDVTPVVSFSSTAARTQPWQPRDGKSPWVAAVLTFLAGPFGMLYVGGRAALLCMVVYVMGAAAGGGALTFVWLASAVAAYVATSRD